MLTERDKRRLQALEQAVEDRDGNPTKTQTLKFVAMTCKDCIFDPTEPGGWHTQVRLCTVDLCPLYAIRERALLSMKERT